MTQQDPRRTESLVELSSREMQEVLGGSSADLILKRRDLDRATNYVGSANGGVWKTTNFLGRE